MEAKGMIIKFYRCPAKNVLLPKWNKGNFLPSYSFVASFAWLGIGLSFEKRVREIAGVA